MPPFMVYSSNSNHDRLNSMKNDNILHQCIGTIVTSHNIKSDCFFFIFAQKYATVQFPLDHALLTEPITAQSEITETLSCV